MTVTIPLENKMSVLITTAAVETLQRRHEADQRRPVTACSFSYCSLLPLYISTLPQRGNNYSVVGCLINAKGLIAWPSLSLYCEHCRAMAPKAWLSSTAQELKWLKRSEMMGVKTGWRSSEGICCILLHIGLLLLLAAALIKTSFCL